MRFSKLIIAMLLSVSFIFAMSKDEIKPQMSMKIDKILHILSNKKLNKEEKGKEIVQIIDKVFDYSVMSKISLGREWKNLSKEQKNDFTKEFETRLKNSYIEKLDLYGDQKIEVKKLAPYKKSRLQLQTQLVGAKDNYAINYNFYNKRKANDWYIYDVELAGVSIIQNYRHQFAGQLKEKSFKQLLEMLKKQNSK